MDPVVASQLASVILQAVRLNISETSIMAAVDGKTGEQAIAALQEICQTEKEKAHKAVGLE